MPNVHRKSVQRGMAVAQLRGEKSVQEPIVKEILSLTEKSLSSAEHQRMTTIFTDNTKNIQFILSNTEEYKKVNSTKAKTQMSKVPKCANR